MDESLSESYKDAFNGLTIPGSTAFMYLLHKPSYAAEMRRKFNRVRGDDWFAPKKMKGICDDSSKKSSKMSKLLKEMRQKRLLFFEEKSGSGVGDSRKGPLRRMHSINPDIFIYQLKVERRTSPRVFLKVNYREELSKEINHWRKYSHRTSFDPPVNLLPLPEIDPLIPALFIDSIPEMSKEPASILRGINSLGEINYSVLLRHIGKVMYIIDESLLATNPCRKSMVWKDSEGHRLDRLDRLKSECKRKGMHHFIDVLKVREALETTVNDWSSYYEEQPIRLETNVREYISFFSKHIASLLTHSI